MEEMNACELAFKNGYEKGLLERQIRKSVLALAISTYGKDMQLTVAIEELSELIKEICKHKRGADNTEAIVEEMADCHIMLEQLEMIFGLEGAVIADAIDKKVKRLERRLGEQ